MKKMIRLQLGCWCVCSEKFKSRFMNTFLIKNRSMIGEKTLNKNEGVRSSKSLLNQSIAIGNHCKFENCSCQ